MKLTLEVEKKHKEQVTIPIPCFWKNPSKFYDEWIGVLDDKTFCMMSRIFDGDEVWMKNGTVERNGEAILKAHSEYNLCSEKEFMDAYDDAWESIRLRPQVIETGTEEAHKQLMRTENF